MEEENTIKEEQSAEEKPHKPFKRYIFAGVLVLLAVGGGFFIHDILNYQSTDDAYVETTTVQVAPRVSGQITDVYITDNQPVTEGMLVAKIDDADYKAIYDEEKAKYERVLLNQKNAKAVFTAAQTKIDVAKKDLDRYTNLYAQGAVSKQTLDNAQAAYDAAQANRRIIIFSVKRQGCRYRFKRSKGKNGSGRFGFVLYKNLCSSSRNSVQQTS